MDDHSLPHYERQMLNEIVYGANTIEELYWSLSKTEFQKFVSDKPSPYHDKIEYAHAFQHMFDENAKVFEQVRSPPLIVADESEGPVWRALKKIQAIQEQREPKEEGKAEEDCEGGDPEKEEENC